MELEKRVIRKVRRKKVFEMFREIVVVVMVERRERRGVKED